MESSAAVSLGLGLVSVAGTGAYNCFRRRQQRLELEKARVSALVLSAGTGKSCLCEHLGGFSGLKVIDVSDAVDRKLLANSKHLEQPDKASDVEYLIHAKEYVENVKKSLPKYKLVLLCNSLEEARYLGVLEVNMVVCTPSQALLDLILKGKDLDVRERVVKERLELISQCDGDKINVFTSYDDLYAVIKASYKLRSKW